MNVMEEKRVADYFVVAGLPDNPIPLEEFSTDSIHKQAHTLDPVVDVVVINTSLGELPPMNFFWIQDTTTGFPANLNHGGIRAPEMFLCFRRGRDKPPLLDIGVFYESKERVLPGCEVITQTPYGRSANVNNSNSSNIFITYRRADVTTAYDALVVVDICVILANKGEIPPYAFRMIEKTLNKGLILKQNVGLKLKFKKCFFVTYSPSYGLCNPEVQIGSDVFLCYKKSTAKTHFITYQPAVLSRYPMDEIPGLPFPENVAMFCLPLGATIESWPANALHPSSVFLTFVLTAATGDKLYGAAIIFYEDVAEKKLDKLQRKQLGIANEATPVTEGSLREAHESRTVHQNKCVCLLSRSAFFHAFKQFLVYLIRMSSSGHKDLIPIERYIVHFLMEVPYPSPQRPKVLVQDYSLLVGGLSIYYVYQVPIWRVACALFPSARLPSSCVQQYRTNNGQVNSGASFMGLLRNLGATNCIALLLWTLIEQKLLLHSHRPALITSVVEAVTSMIFPFRWQCPYIPLCPLSLSYVLNSPTPFIVGIDSRYFDYYDPPNDVICVDLDTGSVSGSVDRRDEAIKMLPKVSRVGILFFKSKAMIDLRKTLERLYEQLCYDPLFSSDNSSVESCLQQTVDLQEEQNKSRRTLHMELAIQETFLRFMAVVMKGYASFLLPITKEPTNTTMSVKSLFNMLEFLKSRDPAYYLFYVSMMKTQSFSRFIEERSFVSDQDTGLMFFDECIEKVNVNRNPAPRLIELDDARCSDMTVFVMMPEPAGHQPNTQYSYNCFPKLDPALFPCTSLCTPVVSVSKPGFDGEDEAGQPGVMTRRTIREIKSSQRLALQDYKLPIMWAKYDTSSTKRHAYVKTVHSKSKALRTAYDVLVRMQGVRLQPPDEVCYRVLMQLCGLYHQPVLAVKVLFAMRQGNVQPNAVTYGFYNQAVLESKWPSSGTSAYQRWMKLKHTLVAISQFKRVNFGSTIQSTISTRGITKRDFLCDNVHSETNKNCNIPGETAEFFSTRVAGVGPFDTVNSIDESVSTEMVQISIDSSDGFTDTATRSSADLSVVLRDTYTSGDQVAEELAANVNQCAINIHAPEVRALTNDGSCSAGDNSDPRACENHSSRRLVTGSVQSVVTLAALPMHVEMCSLSQCQSCVNLLYDEEIMAGWTPDDSNLNTSCQFCGSKLVPMLQIYIKDYIKPSKHPSTNISQSMENLHCVQSGPDDADFSESYERTSKIFISQKSNDITSAASHDTKGVFLHKDNNLSVSSNRTDIESARIESRRWLSERCLEASGKEEPCEGEWLLNDEMNASHSGGWLTANQSTANNISVSNDAIHPISVPYLSTLVLRKEIENVLDQEGGDSCLNETEFIDRHPILYWNLLWYFKRIGVPTHMLEFVTTAMHCSGNNLSSSSWQPSCSGQIALDCHWDNTHLYKNYEQPMYMAWNQIQRKQNNTLSTNTEVVKEPVWSKSTLEAIVSSIQSNNIITPLQLILNERSKRQEAPNKVSRPLSIYRDVLFLSIVALGRGNIDHDAFDATFKNLMDELPLNEISRMSVNDRYPNAMTCACRKVFNRLEL